MASEAEDLVLLRELGSPSERLRIGDRRTACERVLLRKFISPSERLRIGDRRAAEERA